MAWTSEQILIAVYQNSPTECVTEARIAELTGLDARQVQQACYYLRTQGLMEFSRPKEQACNVLTDAGRAAYEQGQNLRTGSSVNKRKPRCEVYMRAWRAMTIRGKFTLPELEMLVADDSGNARPHLLQLYVTALERAGYLIRMPRKVPSLNSKGRGHVRWMLSPDKVTGRHAPVWSKTGNTLYDPNTDTLINLQEARDAVA